MNFAKISKCFAFKSVDQIRKKLSSETRQIYIDRMRLAILPFCHELTNLKKADIHHLNTFLEQRTSELADMIFEDHQLDKISHQQIVREDPESFKEITFSKFKPPKLEPQYYGACNASDKNPSRMNLENYEGVVVSSLENSNLEQPPSNLWSQTFLNIDLPICRMDEKSCKRSSSLGASNRIRFEVNSTKLNQGGNNCKSSIFEALKQFYKTQE